jgi:hypothetical protein
MHSLDQASVEQDISSFTSFLANLVSETMRGNEVAKLPAI